MQHCATLKTGAALLWFILFSALLLPNVFYASQSAYFGSVWDGLQLLLFAASTLLLPLCVLPLRIYLAIATVLLALMPAAMLHIALLGQPTTLGSILNAFSGTPHEAWTIIRSCSTMMSASLILVLLAESAAFLIAKYRLDPPRRFKVAAAVAIAGAYVLVSLPLDSYNNSKGLLEAPRWKLQLLLGGRLNNGRGDLFPSGMVSRIGRVVLDSRRLKQWKAERLAKPWEVTRPIPEDKSELHVLVIGETSRRDHWQLYGYGRETTPRMARENGKDSGLVALTNVVSPANMTIYALMQLLSRARPHDMNRAYQEPSIINAYKQAGFKTYWISNSEMIGKFSTPITMLADDADEKMFTSGSADEVMDSVLVDRLDKALKDSEAKKFIIVHMQGSHFDYRHRFTEEFNKFQPSYFGRDLRNWTSPTQKEELINTYDNTLLYSDHILGELLARIKKQKGSATMTFVADHGERLMDANDGDVLHSSVTGSRAELEVPFFVWMNRDYRRLFPEKRRNLKANKDKPISSSVLFDSLLGLGSMTIAGHRAEQDIFSKDLRLSERKVLLPSAEIVDYDKEILPRESRLQAARRH